MADEEPAGSDDVGFNSGCLGLLLVGAISVGAAVALGYGAQWLLGL